MSCPNYENDCEGPAMLRTYFDLYFIRKLNINEFVSDFELNLCKGPDYEKCNIYKLKQNFCKCDCKH